IMNRNSLLSDSFHVGIKSFVQTHFILDKAIMEQYNTTSYLFVSEGDNYQGVVTRLSIARAVVTKVCCIE
ncbi:MAG: hypothetical protein KZQ61_01515, partial [Candidatus Thiodiazotropha sp. (ex Lucinoma aequizonata)]|nr:hypothetical protein [Candidatus Thiodiazotropha sp. (ex Lucinoma aequizonata)]